MQLVMRHWRAGWLRLMRACLAAALGCTLAQTQAQAQAQAQAQTQTQAQAQSQSPAQDGTRVTGAGLSQGERLQVTAAFVELHTGPGRGYPVFFVVERGGFITLEQRRTDWYRVRSEGGRVGWVPRAQLESTLTAAGERKTLRDVLLDDYLGRRLEFGGHWGRFDGEPMLRFSLAWRLADAFGVEAQLGQVQGLFAGTDFWHLNLVAEPWSDQRLSPHFGIGFGRLANVPNLSLVDATRSDAKLATASLGLRWHLSARFVLRADYTLYSAFVSDARTLEYRAFSAGLAFFF